VGGIGISRQKKAGWRDKQVKMGGKAGSENPILDPPFSPFLTEINTLS